ncbi:TIGR03862 family flavoprotein [uncultured Rhodoblastus sp.]|uniref:TIGR03862 family flavoprotein n=1 Tax=uncultured Rhodoblastus sp. TaxID=543037 RepID=UPI0025F6A50D|nr:TIGR03862 family flavoprotein [uncultured Rhodoblastus sp.]
MDKNQTEQKHRTAAVIGAGPAGLMAAEVLAEAGLSVTIYERMASPARKLLMAGRGGLNLTHGENFEAFCARYGAARARLRPLLEVFGPEQLRQWCAGLGQEVFVGSSGRVFPRALKASPLLRAWLRRLGSLGVQIRLRHEFQGFAGDAVLFATPEGPVEVRADATVLALGGASWPRLGADGGWVAPLARVGLESSPQRPANCGVLVDWSGFFVEKFQGAPLKNIALHFGALSAKGEAVATRRGLEGGAVYALSGAIRDALAAGEEAVLRVDLRPDFTLDEISKRLSRPRGKASLANYLRKILGLSPVAIALLRESGPLPGETAALAALIKAVPLKIAGVGGLERAISTAGGVLFEVLDEHLMARSRPGLFLAGEMLDWEAPTGGYLLTACLATGRVAGFSAAKWALETDDPFGAFGEREGEADRKTFAKL